VKTNEVATQPGAFWKGRKIWVIDVKHSKSPDGCMMLAPVALDISGNLYGTTELCGTHGNGGSGDGYGTLFKLAPPTPPSDVWTPTILHSFALSGGAEPTAALTGGADGMLYGTTSVGGASGYGTIYSVAP
jgi:uncharacterized repeat protein (TIGR03803 family)